MRLFQRQRRSIIICKKINKKRFMLGIIIVFMIITIIIFYGFASFLSPTLLSLAEGRARNTGQMYINEAINEKLTEDNISYDDLVTIMTDNEGKITGIKSNVVKMNILRTELSNAALQKINENSSMDINVPILNMFNNAFISARGPKMPVRVIPVGVVETKFYDSFATAGINQTKHEICISAKVTVSIILPIGTIRSEIETNIPVAHTVIVGSVPNTYTNVEGVTSDPADSILNLAPN